VLTGQLGDVMKESARAALSYAKANWKSLGIDEDALRKREVHIHVPAGAIPKDGPSAGITMATALISAVSGRKVRRDVAMTGELTLTGRVLPIGGVKEKVLGAVRAGITEIVLPADNEADLEDLPKDVREQLTFHPAETLDDVIAVALDGKPTRVEAAASRRSRGKEGAEKKAPAKKGPAKEEEGSGEEGSEEEEPRRRSDARREVGRGQSTLMRPASPSSHAPMTAATGALSSSARNSSSTRPGGTAMSSPPEVWASASSVRVVSSTLSANVTSAATS
jgi:hypothetical protein